MPDFFRINYAPVVRVDEPTPAVLYPRNTYRRARGIAALNPTISLAAVDIEVQPTGAGYMAVNYTLDDLAVPFTIRQKPNFAGQTSFVPCISWIGPDGSISRYALANETLGVNQYELYTSQVIDPATAMIELWALGDTDSITLPAWEITIGLLEAPQSSAQTAGSVYTTTQCIVTVTADSGFAAYMTSCGRTTPPVDTFTIYTGEPSGNPAIFTNPLAVNWLATYPAQTTIAGSFALGTSASAMFRMIAWPSSKGFPRAGDGFLGEEMNQNNTGWNDAIGNGWYAGIITLNSAPHYCFRTRGVPIGPVTLTVQL